ncbi:MAG TPA: DUF6807 family protein [Planctomycetota bacterium]|nr:DUF6807 family protein [Planctomycetota bacterium]
MLKTRYIASLFITVIFVASLSASEWTLKDGVNTVESAKVDPPGRKVDIALDGKLVARFIYENNPEVPRGKGQIKPYLHVFGEDGDCLTEWDPKQTFPHHRGIFIGWNKIGSDLGGPPKKGTTEKDPKGTFDLWHFNNGGQMQVLKFEKLEGGPDKATLVATIAWRAGNKDESGSDLLLTETRTLVISRPAPGKTQIDAKFELKPARDLSLGGDLQHSGVHFRSTAEITLQKRNTETGYVWEPEVPNPGGRALSKEFKYARLILPVGSHWYSVTQLNPPSNPVEEWSWRDYGRFGFFFKKELKKDEVLALNYRFLTEFDANRKAKFSADEKPEQRKQAQAEYDEYVKALAK